MLKPLVPFFTIIGAIATVVGTLIGLMDVMPSNPVVINIQLFGARFFAPDGYEVVPSHLRVIPKNAKFVRGIGGTALLTESEVTFAVDKDYHSKGTYIFLDGKRRYLKRGNKLPVGDTECFIWLYHIETEKNMYSYQLKC